MKEKQTYAEAQDALREAGRDFLFEFTKALGLLRLINRLPFVQLKDWVKDREVKQ